MSLQVGNEAARDPPKHSLAYIIRSAICDIVPSAGAIISIHYDKRGAKMAIQYKGDDCAELREKVEDLANSICEKGIAMAEVKLQGTDIDGLKSSPTVALTSEAGGVTIKKFTCNSAKEQLILEFNAGAPKRKEHAPASESNSCVSNAPAKSKDKAGTSQNTAIQSQPSQFDSVPQVSVHLIDELLDLLKAEGITIGDKESSLRQKLVDKVETPLTALKNTAYTRGFKAHLDGPVSNFVVRR